MSVLLSHTPTAFGKERIPHLLNDIRFMMKCLRSQELGLIMFVAKKYFDVKFQENMTIRVVGDEFQISVGSGQWRGCTETQLFDRVAEAVEGDFADFVGVQCLVDRRKPVVLKPLLDQLMVSVGEALAWDLTCPEYEAYDGLLSAEQKATVRGHLKDKLLSFFRSQRISQPEN